MNVRKYFGTDGIRGRVGTSLINPEFVLKLGWAVGRVLANGRQSKVLIGKDTRISGYMLESALEAGLSAAGVEIHLLGPMPTPAIAYLTRTQRAKAGIVISASHNPYCDNGIKFFDHNGCKLPDELELAIEAELEKPIQTVDSAFLGKAKRINDAAGRYIEFCKSTVESAISLAGMKIVVDCANGATYHIAPHVFNELGAEVIEIGVDPDGVNINAQCGSTQPQILQQLVLAEQADLGIALDGDGDRVIMVDHRGEILDGDELLYIIARYWMRKGRLQGGIVGTVMSNYGLEQAIRVLNLDFVRTKVGDRYVISELQRQGWVLGGETSGHLICLGLTTTGDGIIAALQVLAAMVQEEKSLHELKLGMHKYPQELINVAMHETVEVIRHEKVKAAMLAAEHRLNGKGRIVLRPSGTEPLMRIMVEGSPPELIKEIAQELADTVTKVIS